MEPQICFKRWVSRPCWKSCVWPTVIRSQQGPGKKFVVQSGSTWRRQISMGAWQREMAEGWLKASFFFQRLFVSVGSGWNPRAWWGLLRFVRLLYESELTWMGLRRIVYLHFVSDPTRFRQIDSDKPKTLQVLRQRHARSRWSRRSASSVESVATAGRVGFPSLLSHPRSSMAKTSGWRVAKAAAAGGTGHPRGGAAASLRPPGTGRPDRRGSWHDPSEGREEEDQWWWGIYCTALYGCLMWHGHVCHCLCIVFHF